MKPHRIILGVVVALIPLAVLSAAPSITQFNPPPSGQYHIEQLWKVTLNNPDQQTYSVWLEGTILKEGREVFWAQTDTFPLPPGRKTLHYKDVRVKTRRNAPGYEQFAARTGGLPEGNYTFSVKLEPNFGTKSVKFSVKPMGPPRLISPPEGASLGGLYPDFVWSAPVNRRGGVTYRLLIVEVKPGQTKEEALAANPPWLEQTGINSTRLRYPTRARKLDENREYAWRVVAAAGGAVAASETRGFKRWFVMKPPGGMYLEYVTVARRVERERTHFKVYLDVKVIADVEDLKIQVWNTGFQCIPPTDEESAHTAATSNTGARTKWWGNFGNKSSGATFTLSYHAVPILVPDMFWFQWYGLCDSTVVTYRRNGKNYVRRPDLGHWPMGEVEAAFRAADFVIVTCPKRLYPAYDNDDVHYLLRYCGQLARKKNGVLGYTEASTTAPQLKAMLRGNGAWGSYLAPSFRTLGGGYVLLVGEQNIVPSWEVTGLNIKWSGGSVTTRVRLSDFPYSDCTGDWMVDLVVGRAIGRSANQLSRVVESAVTFSTTAKPSPACLVSGFDARPGMWFEMVFACAAGADNLKKKGVNAAAADIGILPPAQKLGALQNAVRDRKLISYFGHGNVNVWGDVIVAWKLGALNYAPGGWVTAFSCLTGNYSDTNAICRAFTNEPGTLGYLGATEVSSHSLNVDLQSSTFWNMYHASGWSPGRALFWTKHLYCLFFNAYQRLAVYEYNLYGCPK